MQRLFLIVLLFALPAFAVEPISAPISEVVLRPAAPSADVRFALSVTTASLLSVSSSVLGGLLAVSLPGVCTAEFGSPKAMCGVAGLALAGATQLLFSLLIIPEIFRISGGDIGAVRAGWWRWARWPAAMLAVSALVFLAASGAESQTYGSGQGAMILGLGGAAASGLSVDVLGLVGAVRAAKGKR